MPYDSIFYKVVDEKWPNERFKHVVWNDGEEVFMNENGVYHRVDGPAIILSTGEKEFWLNGIKVNSLEELIIKNIIE